MISFDLRLRRRGVPACRVRVGPGALDGVVDDAVGGFPGRAIVLVSDSNVAPLYADPLAGRLRAAGASVHPLTFPAGEASKTRETKAVLEDRLVALKVGREALFVALGGGVTGDLAGFTAATWHRGCPVLQAPTTVLSMADAALGGKTAVNLPGAKNLVGALHQPEAVFADVGTLHTLPEEDFRAGFAEVVKAAVIADRQFFRWLEIHVEELLERDETRLEHALARCLRVKARVVREDERDCAGRAALNFGHTVGHALEAASGYRTSHGRAVAIGMIVEARMAVRATGFPEADLERLERLLDAFGLPIRCPVDLDVDAIVATTRLDKKTRAGVPRYALPRRLGRMPPWEQPTVTVDDAELIDAVRP